MLNTFFFTIKSKIYASSLFSVIAYRQRCQKFFLLLGKLVFLAEKLFFLQEKNLFSTKVPTFLKKTPDSGSLC